MEEVLQELWSGYGQILRLRLTGSRYQTVIAKYINLPDQTKHPRGWNTDISHQRKVRSYQIETHWYQKYNPKCGRHCRTPSLLASLHQDHQTLLLLEDLDAAGYPLRLTSVTSQQVYLCLQWLAELHATFLQENPEPPVGLWPVGTYWHLATRPDELEALTGVDESLKAAASAIDQALTQARYQTLVHGDAKLANFCFSQKGDQVAALDFQYVGGGCGMKDVAYFLGSCLDEATIAQQEDELLAFYFRSLREAVQKSNKALNLDNLESEWKELFSFAWADFHRFLKGWSPGHWKLTGYSENVTRRVIAKSLS